ncbi:MAG: hypothetical protein PWQ50_10 [Methanolobus sp.]|jgi:SAM-dependent methyltransferase|nr:hypothetical protein [Methanolobus sp.]
MKYEIQIEENEKHAAAIEFRTKIVLEYEKWYNGEINSLYGELAPSNEEKIVKGNLRENAILTWAKLHQEKKYLEDLRLDNDVFQDLIVLDIGSGGIPSGLAFENCSLYCLDPLMHLFRKLGYPFRYYDPRATFIQGFAEKLPFSDNTFDAIISVNSLDHVDELKKSISEIQRVLKPSGMLRLHLHYHISTILEPIELNDAIVQQMFSWCKGLHKVYESKFKRGSVLEAPDEKYALWSN